MQINERLPKDFLILKGLITAIYIALEVYYAKIISVTYNYMCFEYDFNLLKYIATKVLFLVLLAGALTLYNRNKFLYSIYLLLLLFFYIPNAIIYAMGSVPAAAFLSNSFFVATFLITPYIKLPIPSFAEIPYKYKSASLIAIALALLIPIVIEFQLTLNLKTLLLQDIYKTRDVFSAKLNGVLAYLYNFEAKTIVPVALVYFMIRKKPLWIAFFTVILLYLFVISGNKLVYFTPMLVIFFYYVGKDYTSKITYFLAMMLIMFAFFPIVDGFIGAEKPILSGTFINRFFFIPALTTHFYFDFFDGRPFYFAESHFFNQFVKSPYDMPVGFLITKEYWGAPTAYANNGIVSDGFMNLGYWGVGLFSVLFALLFSLFNSFKLHKGYYGIFFSYIYIILSTPLLTCIITGG
ncbi:MAG: O-antigen polymerase, partial [Bacteroidia bacterium]